MTRIYHSLSLLLQKLFKKFIKIFDIKSYFKNNSTSNDVLMFLKK